MLMRILFSASLIDLDFPFFLINVQQPNTPRVNFKEAALWEITPLMFLETQ